MGTTIGAKMAPTLVPEIAIPVASALSFLGNLLNGRKWGAQWAAALGSPRALAWAG